MADANPGRTKILLVVLLAVILLGVWKGGWFSGHKGKAKEAAAEVSLGERLDALKKIPDVPVDRPVVAVAYRGRRDLFTFSENPQVLRERAEAQRRREQQRVEQQKVQEERREKAQERARKNPPKPAQPRTPPPPEFRYQYVAYIGRFTEPMEYLAVLTKASASKEVKKADIKPVRTGEIIDDKFVIKKIDIDSLVVGYTDPKYRGKTKTVKLVLPKAPAGGKRGKGRR